MSSQDTPEPNASNSTAAIPVYRVFPQFLGRLGVKIVAHLGVDLLLLFSMLAILLITLWTQGGSIRYQESVQAPVYMMLFLLITRSGLNIYHWLAKKPNALPTKLIFLHTLRDWIPFILIDFIYENLHDLSEVFYTKDYAASIMALDVKIFGVELTQLSQRIFHPLLTDYFAATYAIWLILPLVLMYFLSYRNLREDLKNVILALIFAFLLGFIGYVVFPCSPPRYFLINEYSQPAQLYGWFIYNQLQSQWDSLSVVSAGAFPSLHVGISSVALIFAFRFRKRSLFDRILYYIYLPLVVSLWASTIYLRHHWFIDILAGWALAYFACWISPKLNKAWEKLRLSLGLPRSTASSSTIIKAPSHEDGVTQPL